jgi:hypothetical protein
VILEVITAGPAVAASIVANKPQSRVGAVVVVIEGAVAVPPTVPTTSTAVPPLTEIIVAVA